MYVSLFFYFFIISSTVLTSYVIVAERKQPRRRTSNAYLRFRSNYSEVLTSGKNCHKAFKRNGYFRCYLCSADDPFGTFIGRRVAARGKSNLNGTVLGGIRRSEMFVRPYFARKKKTDAPGRFSTYYNMDGTWRIIVNFDPLSNRFFFSRERDSERVSEGAKNVFRFIRPTVKNAKYAPKRRHFFLFLSVPVETHGIRVLIIID